MCRGMSFHKRVLRALGNGPARRNLFGPVDREQLQQDYHVALKQDLEEASRRWGFNFLTEKPIADGDFQWEGISGAKVPLVYRTAMLRRDTSTAYGHSLAVDDGGVSMEASSSTTSSLLAETLPGTSKSGKENDIPRTPERHTNNSEMFERTPVKNNENRNSLKRKQTNITDFYQAKKRIVATPRKSGQ